VFCRNFASNCHHFRVISAFSFWQNGPEAEIGSRRRHSPEIVSLFDRPTEDGFLCPYVLPVYLLPFASFWGFCGFPDFDRKWFRALGGVASRKWRHRSIPRPHFCISGLLTSFVYLFPFKSYSTFSFRLEIPIGAEILGAFWGILDPLVHAYINETPKGTSLRQTASFEPSCMFVRRSVRPLRDCEKKNLTKKYYQKKKVTKSLYFTYAWGRPYPTDCNGSLHIGLGHQRNQSCQFWLL
jgi:hypothetical protein